MKKTSQLSLWEEGKNTEEKKVLFNGCCVDKKVPILFRETVPEIPSTTYGSFGLYKYPAKFIPQVIAFILKKLCPPWNECL